MTQDEDRAVAVVKLWPRGHVNWLIERIIKGKWATRSLPDEPCQDILQQFGGILEKKSMGMSTSQNLADLI